jgi:hypothetical protein
MPNMIQPQMNLQPNVLASLLSGISPTLSGQDRHQQPQQMQQLMGLLTQLGGATGQMPPNQMNNNQQGNNPQQGLGLQMSGQQLQNFGIVPGLQGMPGNLQSGMQQGQASIGQQAMQQQMNQHGIQQMNQGMNMSRDPRHQSSHGSPSRSSNVPSNSQAQLQALAALLLQNKPSGN